VTVENIRERLERIRAEREQFVVPLYMPLLHANFLKQPGLGDLVQRTEEELVATRSRIATAAMAISDVQIQALLADGGWRERLVAGWLVGISRRVAFVDAVACLLLASQQPYCGQGYCVALGLIGDSECRRYLREYLSKYLPPSGRFYDQEWAIGALTHLGQKPPQEYLAKELWMDGKRSMNPSRGIEQFAELVRHLNAHSMGTVL
jgi:hypothetical protein